MRPCSRSPLSRGCCLCSSRAWAPTRAPTQATQGEAGQEASADEQTLASGTGAPGHSLLAQNLAQNRLAMPEPALVRGPARRFLAPAVCLCLAVPWQSADLPSRCSTGRRGACAVQGGTAMSADAQRQPSENGTT